MAQRELYSVTRRNRYTPLPQVEFESFKSASPYFNPSTWHALGWPLGSATSCIFRNTF